MPTNGAPANAYLKIYKTLGQVWYADGNCTPTRFPHDLQEFLESEIFLTASAVRLIGTLENAPIIAYCHRQKTIGALHSVQLGTPRIGSSRAERKNAPLMLLRSNACAQLAPSLGGWHEMGEDELFAYQCVMPLARHYLGEELSAWEIVTPMLQHALWSRIGFISHLDPLTTALLLGEIRDPRWYVDRVRPDRLAALEQYLGLNPQTMLAVKIGSSAPEAQRCRLVLRSWMTTTSPGDGADWFLMRDFQRYGGDARAELKTCKRFIAFLHGCWQAMLYPHHPECGLIPKHFFNDEYTSKAFEQHLQRSAYTPHV